MKLTGKWRRGRAGLYVRDRCAWANVGTFLVYEGDSDKCIDGWESRNLVVDDGKSVILGQLFGQNVSGLVNGNTFTYAAPMNSLGVGTDATAAAVTQFQLNPSVAGSTSLIAITSYAITAASGSGPATAVVSATWGTGVANFSWNEWGIFNGTTNGTSVMFDRAVITPYNKTTAVAIQLTVTVTQA